MTAIDLVPPEAIARRETRRGLRRWAVRFSLSVILAAAVYGGLVSLAAGRDAELQALTGRYTALQDRLARAETLLKERSRLSLHREAIGLIRSERTAGWFLEVLGQTLTPESYLRSLTLNRCPYSDQEERDKKKKEPCGADLTLRGHAPGHEQVGQIIRGLVSTGHFKGVRLVSVTDPAKAGKRREVDFEIQCVLSAKDVVE